MVAYSFRSRFVEPIRVGLGIVTPQTDPDVHPKRQTIRAIGKKRHARPGESVQLYYGLRTSKCFQIGSARCTSAPGIRIQVGLGVISIDDYPAIKDADDLDVFAQADGFADWADMRAFWHAEHDDVVRLGPFVGVLIRWEPIT